MSGIFKGDSIYKSGGGGGAGGGGYSDGGTLNDSYFIKIDNNKIYSYQNTFRTNVNFYYDYDENTFFNSIINVENLNINSNINVYYKKDGFYYLVNSTGQTNVDQNKNYVVNINNGVYSVQEETINNAPFYFNFSFGIKKIFKVGNYYWTEDLGVWKTFTEALEMEENGWSLPGNAAQSDLSNSTTANDSRSTSGWSNTQGTNSNGLNFYPYGYLQFYGGIWQPFSQGTSSLIFSKGTSPGFGCNETQFINSSSPQHTDTYNGRVRLVKHV